MSVIEPPHPKPKPDPERDSHGRKQWRCVTCNRYIVIDRYGHLVHPHRGYNKWCEDPKEATRP